MFKVTLQGDPGPQGPRPDHRHRRRARRRLHLRHPRAHRHHHPGFDDLFADINEGTDAVVRAESTFNDGFGSDIRGRIDQSLLTDVLATDGVADADGQVQGFAQYVDADGDAIGNPGQGAPTLGFSWPEVEELNPFVLVGRRAPDAAPTEVVIDKNTADDAGYEVGDTVEVLTQEAPQEYTLSGIARFGTADSPAGATVALFDLPTAQADHRRAGQVRLDHRGGRRTASARSSWPSDLTAPRCPPTRAWR